LKSAAFCVSFYGWNKADLFIDAWRSAGFRIGGHLVFRKRYPSSTRFLRYQHEQAYLARLHGRSIFGQIFERSVNWAVQTASV